MSTPEPLISDPSISPEQHAALEQVLRALWRLIQGITIYDSNHPAAHAAAAEAAAASASIEATPASVPLLRVTPEGFLLGDVALSRAAALVDLARLLHRLRIAMIGIPAHASTAAFLALAAALTAKKSGEHWTQHDSNLFAATAASEFRVYTVTYDALRIDSSDAGTGASRFEWSSLARALCPGLENASTDELALAIEQTLKSKTPSSTPAATRPPTVTEQLALTIQSAPDEQRQAAVTRVSALIERLSPEGRARLLKIDESRAAESLAAVSDLCDSADAGDILIALDRVGDPSKLVCAESVRLLTKIAITARGDQDITTGLRQVVARATSGTAAPHSHQMVSLLRSFQQLMERSSADRFNPEDYERLLQQLGSATTPQASNKTLAAILDRLTDPCPHAANLLAELTASEQTTAADAAGIYRRLHTSLDAIADSGDPDLLLRAVKHSQRFLGSDIPSTTTAAVRQLTLRLADPEVIRRILAGAAHGKDSGNSAMELFAALGPVAVASVLQACTGDATRPDVLQLPIHPSVNTSEVMSHLVRTDIECAIRLLRARSIPASAQAALAALLIATPNSDVSADAFAALHACLPSWSLAQIAAALKHPCDRIRVFGMDKSRSLDPQQQQTLLKPILIGVIDAPLPLSVLSAAVQTVAASGPEGQRFVIALCATLLRRLSARRFDTLLMVMDILSDRSTAHSTGRIHISRLQLFLSILRAALNGARP